MKSFGLWYSLRDCKSVEKEAEESIESEEQIEQLDSDIVLGQTESQNQKVNEKESEKATEQKKDNDNKESEPVFCIHANFWSLEECPQNVKKREPYLDIGIDIANWTQIETMTFFCPFLVNENDFEDLSEKTSSRDNATIIFNEDCEIHTKGSYTIVEKEDGETKFLVFPLNQAVKDVYKRVCDEAHTYFRFNFGTFSTFLENSEKHNALKDTNRIYLRFRIKGSSLSYNIYFDSEPMNKSFESAFSGTRMIDFKINEKRNIEEKVRAEISVNHEKFAALNRVHFLVMEPSAYEVRAFGNQDMSCRELEEGLWDNYFGDKLDFSKGHILAYHWKTTKQKDSYSCLVKVNYSKAKRLTIFSYALIVVALGIISSAVITLENVLFPTTTMSTMSSALIYAVTGFGLLGFGIFLGHTSK